MFAETNKYNTWVVKGHEAVIDSFITDYEEVEHYLVGYRRRPEWFDVPEDQVSDKYGYFLFNFDDGTLIEGLTENQLNMRLKEVGVNEKLDISKG